MAGKEADSKTQSSGVITRTFVAALIVVAVLFTLRAIAPQTIGEQVRRHLQKQLAEHYVGHEITIGSGRYEPATGLIFEDIRVADPSVESQSGSWSLSLSQSREIVHIEKLVVVADTKPERLLDRNLPLVTRRIVIDGLNVETWLKNDGTLSIQELWPPPKMGPEAPRTEIYRANIKLVDLNNSAPPIELKLSEINVVNQTKLVANPNNTVVGSPALGSPALGSPALANNETANKQIRKTISLQGSTSFARSLHAQAVIDDQGLELGGKVQGFRIGPDLFDRLPSSIAEQAKAIRGLQCVCDVAVGLRQAPGGELDYRVKTTVHSGRFDHPRLPESLTGLSALISCDPGGVHVESSQAICGEAVCRVSGSIDEYKWPEKARFQTSVMGLRLDDRLAKSLTPKLQEGWKKLQPKGRVDIVRAELTHPNGEWLTDATVDCKGVDVRYEKFPYPVDHVVGRMHFKDHIVWTDEAGMSGRIGGRRFACAFRLPTKLNVTHEKAFVIATDGPVAIDRTLLSSLSPIGQPQTGLERFVRSLEPRGSVFLEKATFLTDADNVPTRKIDLTVSHGSLRYEKFAYPLYNITGKIHVEDDLLTLHDFQGTNSNAGQVACGGMYRMPPAAKKPLRLTPIAATQNSPTYQQSAYVTNKPAARDSALKLQFRASGIRMDESLRDSLPVESKHVWDAMSPNGVLDHLDVMIQQNGAGQPLGLNITARESELEQVTNRALSIQPSAIPYRLDITDAVVHYDGNHVTIESIKTRHGATKIAADGGCVRNPNGRWQLMLNVRSGSRVSPDSELIAALPDQLRNAMYQLQLRRPVSIRGRTEFLLPDDLDPDPIVDWDLVLQLEGNRIGDVGPVHSMRGELSTRGRQDSEKLVADGEVRIDSIHLNDIQITGIRGPYSILNDKLQLGATKPTPLKGEVQQASHNTGDIRKIQGQLFGGLAELSGDVVLSTGAFDVGTSLLGGRIPEILAELGHGRNTLTGTMNGQAEIEGLLGTTDLLKGVGSARVTGANLYQLPLLVQLLNLLRITPTEDVAFTDLDVDFTMVENAMTFSDLKMWGDLVALHGGGTLDRRRQLDLTFDTRVSPQHGISRVLRPLRTQRYTLLTVDVDGPLEDPRVERRALDGVGQTLGRLAPWLDTRSQK